jgi:hypothetical protein
MVHNKERPRLFAADAASGPNRLTQGWRFTTITFPRGRICNDTPGHPLDTVGFGQHVGRSKAHSASRSVPAANSLTRNLNRPTLLGGMHAAVAGEYDG